jgi:hypothetical protein
MSSQEAATVAEDAADGEEVMVADEGAGDPADPQRPKSQVRRFLSGALTAMAFLFVLFALVSPDDLAKLGPGSFARIPLEGLLGLVLVLLLPVRWGRVAAALAGLGLGLLMVIKLIDTGSFAVLGRPWNLVLDWVFLGDGLEFVTTSAGHAGAVGVVIGVVLLAAIVPVLMTLSAIRLTKFAVRNSRAATGTVAVLGVLWLAASLLSLHIVPGRPLAARSAMALTLNKAHRIKVSLHDHQVFAKEAKIDAFRNTPSNQMLTGLKGKDVVLAFIESYGRSAVEDPRMAPAVDAVLDSGTSKLKAAGYASRSGFLTSPTAGGGSVLAHATLLSGLWIDNRQRYKSLTTSDRFTLNQAFQRANWRSVAVVPGITQTWPEGGYFGYDKIYAEKDLGYQGPKFGWATMTDQYVMSAFEKNEHAKAHAPIMAEIPLVSSHIPWAPIPSMIDWDAIGDGSIFTPMQAAGKKPSDVWPDADRIRTEYRRSIEYTLNTLISYVQKYGDDNLVMVFLGDHQPVQLVTDDDSDRDVPITIVAKDPAVLDQISSWGWTDGLRPDPKAPVWKMSDFRDRFLTAFGSTPTPNQP